MTKLPDSGERSEFSTGAVRDASKGKGIPSQIPPAVMAMLARRFEDGAEKYGMDNWKKGIPTHKYIDSLLRHLWAVQEGRIDEDHLSAVVWNAVCLAQTIDWIDTNELPRELETHLYNAGEPSVKEGTYSSDDEKYITWEGHDCPDWMDANSPPKGVECKPNNRAWRVRVFPRDPLDDFAHYRIPAIMAPKPEPEALNERYHKATFKKLDKNGVYIFTMCKEDIEGLDDSEEGIWKYAAYDGPKVITPGVYLSEAEGCLFECKPKVNNVSNKWDCSNKKGSYWPYIPSDVENVLFQLTNELGWNKVLIKFV